MTCPVCGSEGGECLSLFPCPPPKPPVNTPPQALGADARKTWKQRQQINAGFNPASGYAIRPGSDTCKTCVFAWLKSGDFAGAFWKCRKAATRTHAGPDLRLKWPACTQYELKETA